VHEAPHVLRGKNEPITILLSSEITHTISQPLLAFDEFKESLSLTKFHEEIHVVFVFEGIVKVNNVRVLEFHVNFDFAFELSFVPGLLERVFVDDLHTRRVMKKLQGEGRWPSNTIKMTGQHKCK
jgi:hypothetical protein